MTSMSDHGRARLVDEPLVAFGQDVAVSRRSWRAGAGLWRMARSIS
ncbi:hypothetical protein [Streptomyces tubercidicus]